MYDEQLIARIREYLRQNQGQFTFEALRQRLISEGVDPAAIDIAAVELGSDGTPAAYGAPPYGPPVAPQATKFRWGRMLLVTSGVVVANIVAGCASLYFGGIQMGDGTLFMAVAVLFFVAELGGGIYLFSRNRAVSVGLIVAIVATPVVVFALLLGACILLIANEGRIGG